MIDGTVLDSVNTHTHTVYTPTGTSYAQKFVWKSSVQRIRDAFLISYFESVLFFWGHFYDSLMEKLLLLNYLSYLCEMFA